MCLFLLFFCLLSVHILCIFPCGEVFVSETITDWKPKLIQLLSELSLVVSSIALTRGYVIVTFEDEAMVETVVTLADNEQKAFMLATSC